MHLGEFVKSLPKGERKQFRERLAERHSCSVSLVRKWEAWPPNPSWTKEQCRSMVRRHPVDLASIKITEELTEQKVTRLDLRPECWTDYAEQE